MRRLSSRRSRTPTLSPSRRPERGVGTGVLLRRGCAVALVMSLVAAVVVLSGARPAQWPGVPAVFREAPTLRGVRVVVLTAPQHLHGRLAAALTTFLCGEDVVVALDDTAAAQAFVASPPPAVRRCHPRLGVALLDRPRAGGEERGAWKPLPAVAAALNVSRFPPAAPLEWVAVIDDDTYVSAARLRAALRLGDAPPFQLQPVRPPGVRATTARPATGMEQLRNVSAVAWADLARWRHGEDVSVDAATCAVAHSMGEGVHDAPLWHGGAGLFLRYAAVRRRAPTIAACGRAPSVYPFGDIRLAACVSQFCRGTIAPATVLSPDTPFVAVAAATASHPLPPATFHNMRNPAWVHALHEGERAARRLHWGDVSAALGITPARIEAARHGGREQRLFDPSLAVAAEQLDEAYMDRAAMRTLHPALPVTGLVLRGFMRRPMAEASGAALEQWCMQACATQHARGGAGCGAAVLRVPTGPASDPLEVLLTATERDAIRRTLDARCWLLGAPLGLLPRAAVGVAGRGTVLFVTTAAMVRRPAWLPAPAVHFAAPAELRDGLAATVGELRQLMERDTDPARRLLAAAPGSEWFAVAATAEALEPAWQQRVREWIGVHAFSSMEELPRCLVWSGRLVACNHRLVDMAASGASLAGLQLYPQASLG